jgi:enoyl-CoA hydratase
MALIELERDGNVAIVSFAAPETRNALTREMAQELVQACEEIDADRGIGAVVLRGQGGYFCAGAHRDLLAETRTMASTPDLYTSMDALYGSFVRVGELSVPSIAAVRGGAVGAGVNLALSADLRVIGVDATLMSGFLRLGVHGGGGHFHLVGRLAGRETAAAMGLFGEPVDGRRARDLGLAWRALPDGEVEDEAVGLAQRVAADPLLARVTVRTMRLTLDATGVPWRAATELEHGPQVWSLQRAAERATKEAGP